MPFRIMATTMDVQSALTNQGYTATRAGNLDRLDAHISSRADGAHYTATRAGNLDRLDATISSRANGAAYTDARAGNLDRLDANISSRAAPGAAMALTPGAEAAIWNEPIPATPAAGSYGERINSNLDVAVGSRAAPGAAMDLAPAGETKVRAQVDGELTERGYTAARAGNLDRLDTTVSSRAAPGAAMDIIAAARAAIWNELIPATPAAGSFGERIKANLDTAVSSRAAPGAAMGLVAPFDARLDTTVSSRAAPGAAMDLAPAGETKVRAQVDGEFTERGYTSARANNLDNLNATVSSRATPADVDAQLGGRGVTTARMAKMDMIAAIATNSGSVAAANNTAGLTVSLDTGGAAGQARAVIEVRYSCGGPATLLAEGSEDNVNWFMGDEISETAAVTNKLVGYLNAHRFFRFRSPTTGIDLNFDINALL